MRTIDPKEVGNRLRAIQTELGIATVDEFGKVLRASTRSQASNWLNGQNLPRVPSMAILLDLVPGLTLDWIYLGVADAMPVKLAIKLQALAQGMQVPTVGREP